MTINKTQNYDFYKYLIDSFQDWGISHYTGMTGGGVIHFLKHIAPYSETSSDKPQFLTLSEYAAGFLPLGYFLASGRVAGAVATTGAAVNLITSGLIDAKLHNLPAVYVVPISSKKTEMFMPLQDSSVYGANILVQLRAILPDSVFVLDNILTLESQLELARICLKNNKPVVFVLDNDELSSKVSNYPKLAPDKTFKYEDTPALDTFINNFRRDTKDKRLVILVGEQMAHYQNAKNLTTELSEVLESATIWSINGANAVSRNNPYGYGYISFGGNDKALQLYESIGEDDVLLVIGACPDEYTSNLYRSKASSVFYMGDIYQSYGMIGSSLQHYALGKYYQIIGSLESIISKIIDEAKKEPLQNKKGEKAPIELNDQPLSKPSPGYVDMAKLYTELDKWWPQDSIGFDDVCLAYKDRQYVVQRPNDNIRFFSLYRGSSMGGAFGAAIGAKLASPKKSVFLFSGDGCFRLIGGCLGEAAKLGIVLFLLNNKTLSIVGQGLPKILSNAYEENFHSELESIDYCGVAKAYGWNAEKLDADLTNLDEILEKIKLNKKQSILIEIPVDPGQILGQNPRLRNL